MLPTISRASSLISGFSAASLVDRLVSGLAGISGTWEPAISVTIVGNSIVQDATRFYLQVDYSADGVAWNTDSIALITPSNLSRTTALVNIGINYYYRARLYDLLSNQYGAPTSSLQLTTYLVSEQTFTSRGDTGNFTVPSLVNRMDAFVIAAGSKGANSSGFLYGAGGAGGAYAKKTSAVVVAGDVFYYRVGDPQNNQSDRTSFLRRDSAVTTTNQILVGGGTNAAGQTPGTAGSTITVSGLFSAATDSRAGTNGLTGVDSTGGFDGVGGNGGQSGAYADGDDRNDGTSAISSGGSGGAGAPPSVAHSYGCGGGGGGAPQGGVSPQQNGAEGSNGYVYRKYYVA